MKRKHRNRDNYSRNNSGCLRFDEHAVPLAPFANGDRSFIMPIPEPARYPSEEPIQNVPFHTAEALPTPERNDDYYGDLQQDPLKVYNAAILPSLRNAREIESDYPERIKYIGEVERMCNAEFAEKMSRMYFMQLSNILEYQTQTRMLHDYNNTEVVYDIIDDAKKNGYLK